MSKVIRLSDNVIDRLEDYRSMLIDFNREHDMSSSIYEKSSYDDLILSMFYDFKVSTNSADKFLKLLLDNDIDIE